MSSAIPKDFIAYIREFWKAINPGYVVEDVNTEFVVQDTDRGVDERSAHLG
jgi:hypothetical protein